MALLRMKYVSRQKKNGVEYIFYRRDGIRIPLPRPFGSPAFLKRYAEIHENWKEPEGRIIPGTFRWLATEYLASPEFTGKKPKTRTNYRMFTDMACRVMGDFMVDDITMPDVIALRDKIAATPSKANDLIKQIRIIYGWGLPRGRTRHNPADFRGTSVRKLKTGEYMPWPEPLIAKFLKDAKPEVAAVVMVGLYSGQRIGDVLKMGWGDIEKGKIKVIQEKTEKSLKVPLHRDLQAFIAKLPAKSIRLLTTPTGRVWTYTNFNDVFTKERKRLGCREFQYHGLRKNAVIRLLLAGCTTQEAGAITGQTDETVAYYARQIEQEKLADAAMAKWESVDG